MENRTQILKNPSPELVLRINELYHDFEKDKYSGRHPEIYNKEKSRLESLFSKYLDHNVNYVCLDYGAGTGFVSGILANYLQEEDVLMAADISKEILESCKEYLYSRNFTCQIVFKKIDTQIIPVADNSVDLIVINSVLHHLPNIELFSMEAHRILSKGGKIIVCHEPYNGKQYSRFHQCLISSIKIFNEPINFISQVIGKSQTVESVVRKMVSIVSSSYRDRNTMLDNISKILVKEKLLSFQLSGTEIQKLVDVQVERGFTKEVLFKEVFKNFKLLDLDIYNHLGYCNGKLCNWLESYFKKRYPESGSMVAFVMIKY